MLRRFNNLDAALFVRTAMVAAAIGLFGVSISWAAQDGDAQPEFRFNLGAIGGAGGSGGEVTLSGKFEVAEGSRDGRISITAEMLPTWHVYSITQLPDGPIKSELKVERSQQYELVGSFRASVAPHVKHYEFFDVPVEEHPDTVTWTAPLRIADGVDPEALEVRVNYTGQVCQDEGACIPIEQLVVAPFAGYYEAATRGGFDRSKLEVADPAQTHAVWGAIGMALLGGFILNFMPCVLPVIGLKIMSFVDQAGESRSRAFSLNVWYSLGMLSVFLVLATLATGWNLGWGQQSQSDAFNITMAAIVFVMGLSFLGVWEIPIPGFVGSGAAGELAEREGVAGAFLKGVVTTILAVPCSGPLLGTALAWSAGKSVFTVYMIFAFIGLGMACPYLLIGAFPRLIRFLPKPGAWMETFKQVMGFVLLATVIWICSYIHWVYLLPTLMFLFALWAACWWIGRTPMTANLALRLRAWAIAGAFAAAIAMLAFMGLASVMQQRFVADALRAAEEVSANEAESAAADHLLPWEPFSFENLQSSTDGQKTVLVDFTADW